MTAKDTEDDESRRKVLLQAKQVNCNYGVRVPIVIVKTHSSVIIYLCKTY